MPDKFGEYVWTCTTRNENGSCGPTHLPKATNSREAAKKSFGPDAIVIDGRVYVEQGLVGWVGLARGFV